MKTTGSGYHGFSFAFPTDPTDPNAALILQPGANAVTMTLVDSYTGASKLLKSGSITDKPPTGTVDIHTATEIAGSVSDPDLAGPLMVRIDVDGVPFSNPFLADNTRKLNKTGTGDWFLISRGILPARWWKSTPTMCLHKRRC